MLLFSRHDFLLLVYIALLALCFLCCSLLVAVSSLAWLADCCLLLVTVLRAFVSVVVPSLFFWMVVADRLNTLEFGITFGGSTLSLLCCC